MARSRDDDGALVSQARSRPSTGTCVRVEALLQLLSAAARLADTVEVTATSMPPPCSIDAPRFALAGRRSSVRAADPPRRRSRRSDRVANDTRYGLAAAVLTSRVSFIDEFSRRVQAGMIHVNHGTASQAHVPFGGVKESGQGAYSIGPSAREFFTNVKAVYVKW